MWPADAHAYESEGPCLPTCAGAAAAANAAAATATATATVASPHTGIAVNALIAVASLFAKNKVIARIQFSDVAKVGQLVGKANLPQRHGGVERAATREWVAQRLAAFPRMGLPDFV